jgi:hypothetical protein
MAVTKVTTKVLADDAVTIDKIADAALVTESEGISSNDNDTTIPTSAAVKDYVDTQDATKEDTITGAATTITDTDLTASKALVSNASGKVAASTVTDTELGYISGVTSDIQTQIDSKEDTITGGATTITDTDLTASKALVSNSSGKVAASTVTDTELGYISGVTSSIQTQLDDKGDEITGAATTVVSSDLASSKMLISNTSGKIAASGFIGTDENNDILDVTGQIYFANVFAAESDLPSATTYHGMFAHVHATGYAYYSHAGNWIKLAKLSEISDTTYSISAADSGDNAIIRLTDSDSGTDDITLAAGTNITLTPVGDTITIASTASGSVSDAFKTISISGEDDVVADSATDTLTLAAGSNITLTTDASTDTITIASTASGGGGGSVDVVTTQHTGDSSTKGFALDSTPGDNDAVQVYLNGVYQVKDAANYSISGSTLTFVDAPVTGTDIEFVHFKITAGGGGGISWESTVKTADFTATAGAGYFVNTTSASITVTLPSSPTAGDELTIVDYAGTADTNNITITSSDNINGVSDDALINYERGGVSMVYVDATQGWIAYNANNETATALVPPPSSFSADYLVVAGGGGSSGDIAGGGGAGGLRTSYTNSSSLNGHTETALSLIAATNYTVTVGAGGTGTNYQTGIGNSGVDSTFSTVASTGGGGGSCLSGAGANGGSGGGPRWTDTPGQAVTSPVTQGYNGGATTPSVLTSSGGGGANQVGQNGGGGQNTSSGNGGAGLEVNIIGGSGNYYGGGGGGGGSSAHGVAGGTGGIGGGGNGGGQGTTATSGTPNTGGGGGGNNVNVNPGGNGGSGIVILRYPNTFTITIGSGLTGSTATDGSDKVTTFTAGTGNISFS